MHDFAGKSVLITGAAGGIGTALSKAFSEAGANLVLVDIEHWALSDKLDGQAANP